MALLITAAALSSIAASCPGQHYVDRVLAHAQVESGLALTAIHDNADGRSYAPATVAEAVALARDLLAKGHRIDAGVMQIASANWAALGLTTETVFDPRPNVCGGQSIIADAYRLEWRVSCRYNTGKPDCSNGYAEKIDRALMRNVRADVLTPIPPDPADDLPAGLVDTVIHKGRK